MISKKYEEITKKLEQKIKDPELLSYVKSQILDLFNEFNLEIEDNYKKVNDKINELDKKISNVEKIVNKIDKDITEDSSTLDLEPICCPYCNFNFLVEYDSEKTEMRCPECNNIIALDWGVDDEF